MTKTQNANNAQEWRVTFQGDLAGTDVPQITINSASITTMGGGPTNIQASDPDSEYAYTFDALNRLTRVDQTGQSGGNTVAEKRVDFGYNAIGQFTSIERYKDKVKVITLPKPTPVGSSNPGIVNHPVLKGLLPRIPGDPGVTFSFIVR